MNLTNIKKWFALATVVLSSHQVLAGWWDCEEALKPDRVGNYFYLTYKDTSGMKRSAFARLESNGPNGAIFKKSVLSKYHVKYFDYPNFFGLYAADIIKSTSYGTDDVNFKYDLLSSLDPDTLISFNRIIGKSRMKMFGRIRNVNSGNIELSVDEKLITVPMRDIQTSSLRALMPDYDALGGDRPYPSSYRIKAAEGLRAKLGSNAPAKGVPFKVRTEDGRTLYFLQLEDGGMKQIGWKYIVDDGNREMADREPKSSDVLSNSAREMRHGEVLVSYFTDLSNELDHGEEQLAKLQVGSALTNQTGEIYFEVGSNFFGVEGNFMRLERDKDGEIYVVIREIEQSWNSYFSRKVGHVVKIRLSDIIAESVQEARYSPSAT